MPLAIRGLRDTHHSLPPHTGLRCLGKQQAVAKPLPRVSGGSYAIAARGPTPPPDRAPPFNGICEVSMDEAIRKEIVTLLDQYRVMTIATLRPDGWPHATTVGYANDGMTLYFLCGPDSRTGRRHSGGLSILAL